MIRWEAHEEIAGCGVIHYDRYEDDRGYFQELLSRKALAASAAPIPWRWAQENTSFSHAGVLRGLHLQRSSPQGKLVTCLAGSIIDVCLDLRRSSPTFLRVTRVLLAGDEPKSFWLPPGTAHGFVALTDALIHYKCSNLYDKASDGGVHPFSDELMNLGIWPEGPWHLSAKDRALPTLVDYLGDLA